MLTRRQRRAEPVAEETRAPSRESFRELTPSEMTLVAGGWGDHHDHGHHRHHGHRHHHHDD